MPIAPRQTERRWRRQRRPAAASIGTYWLASCPNSCPTCP